MDTSIKIRKTALDHGALSTIDAVAMAVAVLSPAAAMAYNTTGAALFGGTSTPLAFLVAGIACLCLAFVIIGFSRRMASTGYLYAYCAKTLGPSSGFLVGWLYFFGFFCFVPMTMSGVGGFGRELLRSQFSAKVPDSAWFLIFVTLMLVAVLLNIVGVKINAMAQLGLGLLTILIVIAVNLLITVTGGQSGHSLAPFTFSHTLRGGLSGILYACIFAILCYVGFETGAVLAEETRNPRKAIPASVLSSVLFSVVFYVWTTYSIAIGVGIDRKGAETWAHDPRILATLATQYGTPWLGLLVDLSAIISGFVVSLACIATAARTLYAMGRDQVLPLWFGKTHARYMTPANATITIGLLATIMAGAAGSGSTKSSDPFTIYYFLGSVGSLAITTIYGIACVSGILWLRYYEHPSRSSYLVVIPAIGLMVFALVVYGSIYPGELPPWPYRIVPFVVAVWLLVGLGILWRLKKSDPRRIDSIGSIMGEGWS